MSDQICLPKSYILIIFCIFIGLAAWYIHNDKKKNIDNINYKFNEQLGIMIRHENSLISIGTPANNSNYKTSRRGLYNRLVSFVVSYDLK